MAEIELFHYHPSNGSLHNLDTRFKLLAMFSLTITIFKSQPFALILCSIFISVLFLVDYVQSKRLSPYKLILNIKGFLFFLLLIVLTRSMTVAGKPFLEIAYISIEGLYSGLIYSWKLLLLVILSQIFTSTTNPSDLHGAIYKLFYGVPLIQAGTIATMMTLAISFIPIIFDQYLEVKNASHSRLGNITRNPIKKISSIALPLLQTTLIRADEVAMAMESRCYSDNPTMPDMKFKTVDLIGLLILIVFLTIILLSNM